MNVLLVQAYLGRREPLVYPLGLSYIATAIREHTVSIVDPNVADDPHQAVRDAIAKTKPAVIGFSVRNIDNQLLRTFFYFFAHVRPQLQMIREASPDSRIVLGGAGFSIFPREMMARCPEAVCCFVDLHFLQIDSVGSEGFSKFVTQVFSVPVVRKSQPNGLQPLHEFPVLLCLQGSRTGLCLLLLHIGNERHRPVQCLLLDLPPPGQNLGSFRCLEHLQPRRPILDRGGSGLIAQQTDLGQDLVSPF